MIQKAKFITFI